MALGSKNVKNKPTLTTPKGAPEPVTVKMVTGRRGGVNPLAIELSAKISEQTFADLESTIDSTETLKISGIVLAFDVEKDFSKEDIASMPIVDTAPVDANGVSTREGYIGSSNNPDWTSVQEGKRTKWVSFFNTMLGHSKWLKDLEANIEAHVDAENKKEGHDKKLAAMGKGTRQAALQKLRGRRSIVQNTFRRGIAVVQQKQLVNQLFSGVVNFSYYEDGKGNLVASPSPIILQMVKKPDCFDTFSVTSFLGIDFQLAMDNRESDSPQATWDAILATLKRDEKPKLDPNNVVISNRDQFLSGAAAMLHWMNDETNMRGVYGQIDKAKSLDDVSHLIKTLCNLSIEYNDVFSHLQKKWEKINIVESLAEGTADAKSVRTALTN